MFYTDNPLADADRHEAVQRKWLESRPLCRGCGEPIQEDECYHYNGDKYHTECWEEAAKAILPDYLGGTVDD